ncbi:ornithine decarboxylase [Fusarium sporotrichioides]|uniref:ornithine decarboxylase n=1 Tax=Fusarium sporotrichioides TaxID=5514 RepID=A0A395RVM8_FUSSP|nr:ornithine decarboxylase [Fusarium sporotrichioides]
MVLAQVYHPQHNLFNRTEFVRRNASPEQTGLTAKRLVLQALSDRIDSLGSNNAPYLQEDAFFVGDLGEMYRQHVLWQKLLPRVKPFYAVKCNPHPTVIKFLHDLGIGFDCASRSEIEEVLRLDTDPKRIIYAHPCKAPSYIRYAKTVGVQRMTFDNADELHKIKGVFPDASLLLRIATDDSTSHSPLSKKFGADMATVESLLGLAQELSLNVVGVSFHVGSGASDPTALIKAVQDAYRVFDQAPTFGFNLHVLDVGGGFCKDTFEMMASSLNRELGIYFPASSKIEIIAEPGRYYVASAFTLATNVIARRTAENADYQQKDHMIYVQDGTYGNFSGVIIDHEVPTARILRAGDKILYGTTDADPLLSEEGVLHSIWGATCDGADCVIKSTRFKVTLRIGDWLYFNDMGAYTSSSVTHFNGFPTPNEVTWICSEADVIDYGKALIWKANELKE